VKLLPEFCTGAIAGRLLMQICVRPLLMLFLALPPVVHAQPRLYAALVQSRGYVAGAKLAASGLYRYEGGQAWTHLGWNLPRVRAIAQDPANAATIFLASSNGAARTKDGGKTWRMTTDWRVTEVLDVCFDPNATGHVYLATAFGVWTSNDGGETWAETSSGLSKRYTQSIVVDHTQAGRLFAGAEGGLYLSNDGARTWSRVGDEEADVLALEQSPSAPQLWLAGTQDRGVLLSHDDGNTWKRARGELAQASIYAVAVDSFNAQNLSAAGWNAGVWISVDGGETWQERSAGLPVRNLYETVFDAEHAGRLWIATFEEGVFYSEDLGQTWLEAGMKGAIVFDMVFIDEE